MVKNLQVTREILNFMVYHNNMVHNCLFTSYNTIKNTAVNAINALHHGIIRCNDVDNTVLSCIEISDWLYFKWHDTNNYILVFLI